MENNNIIEVYDENGQLVKIEVLGQFKIEDMDREYVFYTMNDDGVSEEVIVLIDQLVMINGKPKLVSIPEKEKNMVLAVFNNIKDNLNGER